MYHLIVDNQLLPAILQQSQKTGVASQRTSHAVYREHRNGESTNNLPTYVRRPVVNLREAPTHQCGTFCLRELVCDSERLHPLLVRQ